MSHRAADQTPEYVARARVGGKKLRLVADQHDAGASVISQDPHGSGQLLILLILCAGNFLNVCNDRSIQIDLVDISGPV